MLKRWLPAALLAAASPAAAHDWYPLECCHALDCAPVEKVEILVPPTIASMIGGPAQAAPEMAPGSMTGSMVVTTQHGSALVPANFPRRESKDHRMHACMRPGEGGAMRLICIFLPPAM
jgi:hypothetical protein